MRHTLPKNPQFYVTAPQDCPYLEKQVERKLFTALYGSNSRRLNNSLSKQGFRRSQNVLYRPSCSNCNACMSARILGTAFKQSKSQREYAHGIKMLLGPSTHHWLQIHNMIFSSAIYIHDTQMEGMSDMDAEDFTAMIETNVESRIVEYYVNMNGTPELISFP